MDQSTIRLIQKFSKDLVRLNDPLAGWGEGDRYYRYLSWGRAALAFGLSLGLAGLVAWAYVQLRQDPYQQFVRTCRQQGIDASTCNSYWERNKT